MKRSLRTILTTSVLAGAVACTDNAAPAPTAVDRSGVDASIFPEQGFVTSQPIQAVATAPGVTLKALLSVGDPLPGNENHPNPEERVWAPTPDGLGAYLGLTGDLELFASHELSSSPRTATDGITKAFQWARVSRLRIDPFTLSILRGDYVENGSTQLERLCSASWAGVLDGFGYPGYFLSGEETSTPTKGRLVAWDAAGTKTILPNRGLFARENEVSVRGFPGKLVTIGLDDAAGQSELYMTVASNVQDYVSGNIKLYVLKSDATPGNHVGNLTQGQQVDAYWEEIVNPGQFTTQATFQAQVDAQRALAFVRLEDGESAKGFTPGRAASMYFLDTGRSTTTGRPQSGASCTDASGALRPCDVAGSIYRLDWSKPLDPTSGVKLSLLKRSAGAEVEFASPDNLGVSTEGLMVQEDPAYPGFKRAPAIWFFPLSRNGSIGTATKVVEVTNPTCDDGSSDPAKNCWESSGIIDASLWLGRGAWLFDTQAHGAPFTFNGSTFATENGQLLFMRYRP